ncbi:MAG: hypothetical protein R3C59_10040 [Planctomycetaceae bacterium]
MTQQFLTLTEAQEFTGRSRSTLRRFVEGIVKADDSPDRNFVQPTVDEVAKLKAGNQPFSWKVSTELLSREYRVEPETTAPKTESRGVAENDRLVSVLEKTVVVLQEELNEKNRQIAAFQERQREQNLLLKNLHDRFAIAGPASAAPAGTVDAEPERSSAEQGSDLRKHSDDAKQSVWRRPIHLFGWKR